MDFKLKNKSRKIPKSALSGATADANNALTNSFPNLPRNCVLTVMDAQCSLCSKGASWIAKNDKKFIFRIIPLQSDLGASLMTHYGLDPLDPVSWLYLENGRAFTSMDAIIKVGYKLGGGWKLLLFLKIIPAPLRNTLYRFIAKNRYKFFSRTDLCSVANEDVLKRLLR